MVGCYRRFGIAVGDSVGETDGVSPKSSPTGLA